MKDETVRPPTTALGRRDLMKLGAGVVATALTASKVSGQAEGGQRAQVTTAAPGSMRAPGAPRPHTRSGYKNTANRLGNNGPMDDTTRKIVKFVAEFDESKLTPPLVHAIDRTMIDSMASVISAFEEEPVRIAARLAQDALPGPGRWKATVMGYGITTTPELATFANGVLVRMTDFNDNPHSSNLIPGALAIGEALHATGPQVMTAITVGYEVARVGAGEAIAPCMAAGKLMGLDEDRLANALSIALTPHNALNKGEGALSMWKGARSAEATKCGIWAALLARAGMTGPPQPFEGPGAYWSLHGRGKDIKLPFEQKMAIELNWFKRRPAEASSQGMLRLIPEMRAWTKPDEIASITYDMNAFDEISDAPKFDPRNRETADHSLPYIFARALLDGDVYMDSYTPEKFLDPAARALMDKMTFGQVEGWSGNGPSHIVIRKKNGESRTWDTYNGVRVLKLQDYVAMTDEEVTAKFNRACDYQKMDPAQRDHARSVWGNLRDVKDIGDAIQTLATFGHPKPL